jgi:hypothetical protein
VHRLYRDLVNSGMAFGAQMGRAHEGRRAADCREKQIWPRSATKPDRQKIPTVCSATPGRRLPCHCSSPSGLPTNCGAPFSTLLESLTNFTVHLSAHSCSPACIPQPFSHCTQYRHSVSQKKKLKHIFFCLSHHGTVSRAKFPVPDDDGFKLCTSLVDCATQHLQLHPNPKEIGKMILQHCGWICLRRSFLPIA